MLPQQSELPPPSILTSSQLSSFLQHIGFPPSLQERRYAADPIRDLHLLTQLHIHTISTLPYENLWLHYSATHRNTIAPTSTFANAILAGRGRGGYCFQLSLLFNHVLRGLGFLAYLTPVRVRHRDADGVPQGAFSGWVHLVNIVLLSNGSKFSLDVGFGGDGPTRPMPLVDNAPQTNLGSQQIRYTRRWLDGQVRREEGTKVWVYEYRNSKEGEWNAFYAFDDRVEGLEGDFANLNWYTGGHPESFQTFTPLVVKFLRRPVVQGEREDGDQEIYGKRMLVGATVKQNFGEKTEVVLQCAGEEERVQALEKWFGVRLTEEEKAGITGWGSEVGSQPGRDEVWHVRRGKEWSYEWKGPVGDDA